MVVGGHSWFASCCWMVVGSCSWLAVLVDRFVVFYCSEIDYFIVIDILFYCDIYIILLC